MNQDGITSIELLPQTWNDPSIRTRLERSLQQAQVFRAAVAYWTVGVHFVGKLLANRLSGPNGYLCIDVHLPTDIDRLADLVRGGADVRIFCEDIDTRTEAGRSEPRCLLHTKMLLFWMNDRNAELWVGSHNWTNRALCDLNVESSLVVRLADSSSLFCNAAEYLEKVKDICESFDLARVDFYKQLQRKETAREIPTIELEASDSGALEGASVTVFGTDAEELRELGALSNVQLQVFDPSGGQPCLYWVSVTQSGLMPTARPLATHLSFPPIRYAFRYGKRFPKLLDVSEVSEDVLQGASYFVTLDVDEYRRDMEALDPPERVDAWEGVEPQQVVELEDCRDARSANRWSFELADDFVYEFLRLQADHNWESTRQGVRGFGMIGGLNGVLLLARGFQLLPQRIRSRPTEGNSQCSRRGHALRAGLFRFFLTFKMVWDVGLGGLANTLLRPLPAVQSESWKPVSLLPWRSHTMPASGPRLAPGCAATHRPRVGQGSFVMYFVT